MAAAANPSVSGGSQRGVEDPSAAIASPPRGSPVDAPARLMTPPPMPTAVKNDEQPQSAPPVESVVRADGQPVNDQVEIEDEQRVAVVLVPDASGCAVIGISQSEAALNAGEQPLIG